MRIDNYTNSMGARAFVDSIIKFGANTTVGLTWEDIWQVDAAYTFLSSPGTLYMASDDNTNDLGLEVTIEGLDSNWLPVTLVQTLHAATSQTPVLVSTTEIIRVNRAYTSDSTETTGDVYIAREDGGTWVSGIPGTLTNTLAYISAEDQQTKQVIYSVSSKEREALWVWWAKTVSATTIRTRLRIREFGGVFRTRSNDQTTQNVRAGRDYVFPIRLPPRTDVLIQAEATSGSANVLAELDISKMDGVYTERDS